MENLQLLQLIEGIIGKGRKTSKDNYAFYCPFCNHQKRKLEINISNQHFNCWTCNTSGKKILNLFKKLNVGQSTIIKLNDLLDNTLLKSAGKKIVSKKEILSLPEEFIPLWKVNNSPEYKNAIHYLKTKRGLTDSDILKYRLGYCETGEYAKMIIVPSYDINGQLNFFTGRSYYDVSFKHKNPDFSKDIIGFELFINWNLPITIVEGAFDAISVKRNVVPLFGKIVLDKLKKTILQKKVKQLYIVLDPDAIAQALETVQYFIGHGIQVYLVDLKDKDPNELGFEKVTELIKQTKPTTLSDIIKYKLLC